MGNKLLQARCYFLNERIFKSENRLEEARNALETAQRMYQESDLICPVCQMAIGIQPDRVRILPCTHIFHER